MQKDDEDNLTSQLTASILCNTKSCLKKMDDLNQEILLLITLYLKNSKLTKTSKTILEEINFLQNNNFNLLPPRIDFNGKPHNQLLENIVKKLPHIKNNLLECILREYINSDLKLNQSLISAAKISPQKYSPLNRFRGNIKNSNDINNFGNLEFGYLLKIFLVLNLRSKKLGVPSNQFTNITSINAKYKKLASMRGHTNAVYCCTFDKIGSKFVTGGDDNLIKIWCSKSGWLLRTIRGIQDTGTHQNYLLVVVDLDINGDNTLLASAHSDMTVRVWDFQTYEPVSVLCLNREINDIKFSPTFTKKNLWLVVNCADGQSKFYEYNLRTKKFPTTPFEKKLSKEPFRIRSSSFNPTGSKYAVGRDDGFVYVFAFPIPEFSSPNKSFLFERLTSSNSIENNQNDSVNSLKLMKSYFDRDDELDARAPKLLINLKHEVSVLEVLFSNNGDRILASSRDGIAKIWKFDIKSKTWLSILLDVKSVMEAINDSNAEETNLQPNLNSGIPATQLPPETGIHKTLIDSIEWSQDDKKVFSSTSDFYFHVWDSYNGNLLASLKGHTNEVYILACHPTVPSLLMTGSYDGSLVFWDVERKKELNRIQLGGSLLCADFSPDGTQVIVSDHNGDVHLLGSKTSQKLIYNYKSIPLQQFFKSDWDPLRYDILSGNLIDNRTDRFIHLLNPGLVCDAFLEPYPEHASFLILRTTKKFKDSEEMELENFRNDLMNRVEEQNVLKAGESESLLLEIASSNPIDDQKELSRRKRLMKSEAAQPEVQYYDPVFMIPIEADNPDDLDYEGGGFVEDEEDKEEEEDSDNCSLDNNNFVASDNEDFEEIIKNTTPKKRSSATSSSKGGSNTRKRAYTSSGGKTIGPSSKKRMLTRSDASVGVTGSSLTLKQKRKRQLLKYQNDSDTEDYSDSSTSSAKLEEPSILKCCEWVSADSYDPTSYLPQIGDTLVYIKTGHLEFLESSKFIATDLKSNRALLEEEIISSKFKFYNDIFYHGLNNNLFGEELFFCKVNKVQWKFNYDDCSVPYPKAILTLKIYNYRQESRYLPPDITSLETCTDGFFAEEFEIEFWEENGIAPFLILHEVYFKGLMQSLKLDQEVYCLIEGKVNRAVVKSIREDGSLWESVSVKWIAEEESEETSDEVSLISPWEVVVEDLFGTEVVFEDFLVLENSIDDEEKERLLKIVDECMEDEKFFPFKAAVNYQDFPEYLQLISYPVDFGLVKRRLLRNFYRRTMAVRNDVEMMRINAMFYNDPQCDLYKVSKFDLAVVLNNICEVDNKEFLIDDEEIISNNLSALGKGKEPLVAESNIRTSKAPTVNRLNSTKTYNTSFKSRSIVEDDDFNLDVEEVDELNIKGSKGIIKKKKKIISDDEDFEEDFETEDVTVDGNLSQNNIPERPRRGRPASTSNKKKKSTTKNLRNRKRLKPKISDDEDDEFEYYSGSEDNFELEKEISELNEDVDDFIYSD
ncbi:Bromodomain and WD repeat-containing protein 3 [Lobulomyces angularis]|nr:Bromodomain and WD repeat-containing protein 3 [Lobulomyces angularis]